MRSNLIAWKRRLVPGTITTTIDWSVEFGRHAPLDCEIGCGNGRWLRAYAAQHPERDVVGNELVGAFLREVDRRTVRDGQLNIRLLPGDARTMLLCCFADGALARAFVNFPDPWFKKRHLKRRLLNPALLLLLARKVALGGDLTVATDDTDYAAFVRESVTHAGAWRAAFAGTHVDTLPEYPETKYERKWRAMGRAIYYLRYTNDGGAVLSDAEYVRAQRLEYALGLLGVAPDAARAAAEVAA